MGVHGTAGKGGNKNDPHGLCKRFFCFLFWWLLTNATPAVAVFAVAVGPPCALYDPSVGLGDRPPTQPAACGASIDPSIERTEHHTRPASLTRPSPLALPCRIGWMMFRNEYVRSIDRLTIGDLI